MERIRRSWRLAKASWAVLRADRELLVFPAISFVALVAVLLAFFVPIFLVGGVFDTDSGEYSPVGIALVFAFYVVSYTIGFYFNTALVGAAMMRLDGGDPTVRDGLRIASSRLPQIIGYALIAATVGMVLRAISERAGFIGQIIIGFIGFAWSILTFLVVPVLVVEKVGPVAAIKRSGELLRKTWGEQVIGSGGIGIVFALLVVLAVLVGVAFTFVLASIAPVLLIVGVAVTVLAVGAIALIGSALGGIYTAALYRYATTGESGAFSADAMTGAFREKPKGVVGGLLGQ
jgi:Family of unknown function (DUF6159)